MVFTVKTCYSHNRANVTIFAHHEKRQLIAAFLRILPIRHPYIRIAQLFLHTLCMLEYMVLTNRGMSVITFLADIGHSVH
jgi:hypothetical protein